jgi:hypothetical protein
MFKTGNSQVISVPSDFIKHGLVKIGVEYEFIIKEIDVENGEGTL